MTVLIPVPIQPAAIGALVIWDTVCLMIDLLVVVNIPTITLL